MSQKFLLEKRSEGAASLSLAEASSTAPRPNPLSMVEPDTERQIRGLLAMDYTADRVAEFLKTHNVTIEDVRSIQSTMRQS